MDNLKSNSPKKQKKELFTQLKEISYEIPIKDKDYNKLYQQSPYKSNSGLNYTPSKKINLNNVFCTSLTETPLNLNINSPFSPMLDNQTSEISYQNKSYKRQVYNRFSPFKPLITSPINNQRLSEKK